MGCEGKNRIILIYSTHFKLNKVQISYFSDNESYWLYFGRDYLKFKEYEFYFKDKFELIEISEKLDRISDRIRDDFNHYIDDVNRNNNDIFEWWFTPLSSRNIYLSEVFQNVCYLELVKEVCSNYPGKKIVIVVESYSTGVLIEKWADDENISVISISRPYRGKFYFLWQAFAEIGKSILKAFINFTFAKISKISFKSNSKKNKNISSFLDGKTALIDLFVYESNFAEDGSFNDRYFPGLESYLKKNGYNVIYHPTLTETKLNKLNLYKKIRANDRFFIIKEDYLTIFDYLMSLNMAVKAVTFNEKLPYFRDIDISFADSCDNKWVCFDGIFKSILVYYLFLRLGDVSRGKIERIICWHENQLQDKALCLAVNNVSQVIKIIGVQHFIHFSNYLGLYPLDSEYESGLLPDIILTTGVRESIKVRKYLTHVPVKTSLALRYSYLFRIHNQNMPIPGSILLLLPGDKNDAFEILINVCDILDGLNGVLNVYLKSHPDHGKKIILAFLDILNAKGMSGKFEFKEEKNEVLLKSAAVVISTASSSIVEAAVLGIPTILLAKYSALNLNPFEYSDLSFVSICYDSDEFRKSLNKYLRLSTKEREKLLIFGEDMKKKFFNPEDAEEMSYFII
ncbi:hypothetical protein [Methanoplanus limicola]|uniref:Capsule polysaccharide biosynthesis protein n=1 Tax=Methanoplanus limicola DSM 2279 TaxID=937775 RepID=H1YXD5_9EURY|nr:hypothetical protein [Methanoplanus limicola]EHQ36872.1 hypothetical protein Metlim_2838 [Methanoplanus limicola DSM 2279]